MRAQGEKEDARGSAVRAKPDGVGGKRRNRQLENARETYNQWTLNTTTRAQHAVSGVSHDA